MHFPNKKYPDRPKPYVKKAAHVRFTDIGERPHFDRVTFPADFFDPYVPGVYRPATVTVPEPLTKGIDLSIPDELTCTQEAWRQKRGIYTKRTQCHDSPSCPDKSCPPCCSYPTTMRPRAPPTCLGNHLPRVSAQTPSPTTL